MARVRIIGLNKIYENGFVALDHIDLDIRSGEFLVLVGPSGCGKSTLLRSVAGLEAISSGIIEIDNVRVNDLPPAERNIGMVFQDYALYPHMNVHDNLAFGLKMRRMEKDEIRRRIEEVARMLELSELLPRKPAQLSGGQRQRVAIGRALVKRPQVLLLDEPLSNLDAQLRAQTRVEIASLHRRIGSTTIYVTHDQEEAMVLADRIVILNQGRVQQVGPPLEVYQKPINRFVASFIGSPRMNFLEGSLQRTESGFLFETEGQSLSLRAGDLPPRPGRYVLGFRPEAFLGIDDRGLAATLTWIELHGHEIHVVAKIGNQRITLRTGDPRMMMTFRALAPQERFHLELDQQALHWFQSPANQSYPRSAQ